MSVIVNAGAGLAGRESSPKTFKTGHIRGVGMREIILAAAAIGLTAAPASAQQSSAPERIEFLGSRATVLDGNGRPVFRGTPDFVLKYAGSDGVVQAWNPDLRRVRIGAAGAKEAWLRCSDLKPMAVACAAVPDPEDVAAALLGADADEPGKPEVAKTRGFSLGSRPARAARPAPAKAASAAPRKSATPASAIPLCPGDPRCPGL